MALTENNHDDSELVAISALNQYAYCPRRCYLIHAEAGFEDNLYTMQGTYEHERVDEVRHEVSEGVRVEYGLPIWNRKLGLSGRCDAVEFHVDGTIYPVEYKHGKRHQWINDDLQVCAQAICLEEMMGVTVPRGAIFHHGSRRRREVIFDQALRELVESTVAAIRAMLASQITPPPVNDARCKHCSLLESCMPAVIGAHKRTMMLRTSLFEVECP